MENVILRLIYPPAAKFLNAFLVYQTRLIVITLWYFILREEVPFFYANHMLNSFVCTQNWDPSVKRWYFLLFTPVNTFAALWLVGIEIFKNEMIFQLHHIRVISVWIQMGSLKKQRWNSLSTYDRFVSFERKMKLKRQHTDFKLNGSYLHIFFFAKLITYNLYK